MQRVYSFSRQIVGIAAAIALAWSLATAVVGYLGYTIYLRYEEDIWRYVREQIGLEEFEQEVRENISRLNGEDRVIKIEEQRGYADEPVRGSDPVWLNWTMKRTAYGGGCDIVGATVIFKGKRNVPMPGEIITPTQNFTTDYTAVRTMVQPPIALEGNRIRVFISLKYNCYGEAVTDRTTTITYLRLPALKGADQ